MLKYVKNIKKCRLYTLNIYICSENMPEGGECIRFKSCIFLTFRMFDIIPEILTQE